MRKRLVVGVGILVLLLMVGAVAVWRMTQTNRDSADVPVYVPESASADSQRGSSSPFPSSAPAASTTAASTSGSAPASSTRAADVPAGCMPNLTEIAATTFTIDAMKVNSPVLSLGEDESGAAAAPPKNASHSVGWWKNGPKVGSTAGHAILTIHTYQNGKALGNELNSARSGLKPGDLVRMSDANGNTQCYQMERALKVWVKDYDPNSDVLYKFDGAPRAVIVICWDYNNLAKEWDSRILYYLKPLANA